MKKFFFMSLAVLMAALTLTSCGSDDDKKKDEPMQPTDKSVEYNVSVQFDQVVLDICDITANYKDASGKNAQEKVTSTTWSKTIKPNGLPVHMGVNFVYKVKEDKRVEKAAYALNESLNGILLFREQFFKGIRTLKGSKEINLSPSAVHYQLAKGNRGKFCILCCRLVKSRLAFRYMRSNGKESPSFSSVGLYQSLEEAGKAMDEFKQMYPADRAFEVVCI